MEVPEELKAPIIYFDEEISINYVKSQKTYGDK